MGNFAYALFCFITFVGFVLVVTGESFNQVTGYFILNAFIFFLAVVSFSIMVTSVVKNGNAITGIKYIFIMGSSFICGIFVRSDYLPAAVKRIASFTPSYWFAQNNELIGKTIDFNQRFFDDFFLQSGILLGFTVFFWIIHLVTMREKKILIIF